MASRPDTLSPNRSRVRRLYTQGPPVRSIIKWKKVKPLPSFSRFTISAASLSYCSRICRKVLLLQRIRFRIRSDNRLHRYLIKSRICKVQHIFGKIQIVMGKGTADVIALALVGSPQTSGTSEAPDRSCPCHCGTAACSHVPPYGRQC